MEVKGILILDMSYTLKMFRERQLEQALESRKLEGYFDRVISVHPLVGLFESGGDRYGDVVITQLDDSHVFVEGKIGISERLKVLGPLNFVLAQVRLVRLLVRMGRDAGVSVVRVGDPYYLGLMGWVLARLLRVPLAIRVPFRYDDIRRFTGRAVMPRLFRFPKIEKLIEQFVFPRCDLIAGANEDNMRYAIENGGRPERATVFRYGNLLHASHWIDPAERPDATADLKEVGLDGRRFVATVARLEPMKKVEDTIRVVAELVNRGCEMRALIVGDGGLRQQLEDYSRSLGLNNTIVFAGNRSQQWIVRVLPHAAVILAPHMGRALAEAALSAVPIVAFDYDWQREVVVDGETGFLVPDGDWRAMAERTQRLLADPALAGTMGCKARVAVAEMMDPIALIRHEQTTYTNLLEKWTSRSRPRISLPEKAAR